MILKTPTVPDIPPAQISLLTYESTYVITTYCTSHENPTLSKLNLHFWFMVLLPIIYPVKKPWPLLLCLLHSHQYVPFSLPFKISLGCDHWLYLSSCFFYFYLNDEKLPVDFLESYYHSRNPYTIFELIFFKRQKLCHSILITLHERFPVPLRWEFVSQEHKDFSMIRWLPSSH